MGKLRRQTITPSYDSQTERWHATLPPDSVLGKDFTVGRPRLEVIDVKVLPFMALLKSYCSHAVIHELPMSSLPPLRLSCFDPSPNKIAVNAKPALAVEPDPREEDGPRNNLKILIKGKPKTSRLGKLSCRCLDRGRELVLR